MDDKGHANFEEFNFLENRLNESANLFEKLKDETMKYFAIQPLVSLGPWQSRIG